MSIHLAKNKNNDFNSDEYMNNIIGKCEKKMILIKKPVKINDEKISIPTIETYNEITQYNYNVAQLKSFAKHFKLKISGNKPQLSLRIFSYLYFSSYAIKIQKIFRGMLVKKYKLVHGPAAMNRKICNNAHDFITMEPVEEINFYQFLSYKDLDGFIYGFDIISLYNLFLKSKDNDQIRNPYNRNTIPETAIKNIKSIVRLSRILKIHINLHYEDDSQIHYQYYHLL